MSSVYFIDTNALSKRYVLERGTAWIQGILHPNLSNTIYIARITGVELVSAITRRERGGTIAPNDAQSARSVLRAHLITEYKTIEITPLILERAMTFAENFGLRGYDAVQLASTYEVNVLYTSQGLPAVTLVSSDTELNTAALALGLAVNNPNDYP